jgi:hypothetical protein
MKNHSLLISGREREMSEKNDEYLLSSGILLRHVEVCSIIFVMCWREEKHKFIYFLINEI